MARVFLLFFFLLGVGCATQEEDACKIERRGARNVIVRVSGDCRGQDFSGRDLSQAEVSGTRWGNTICPDGSNSDEHEDGTCIGHLDVESAADMGRDGEEDITQATDIQEDFSLDLEEDLPVEDLSVEDTPEEDMICSLSCPARGARCEGRYLVEEGEGRVTADCACDYGAVREELDCLEEGLWCVQGACGVPVEEEGFVRVEPGSFTMGSPAGEPGRLANEAQVEVTLTRAFWMQATEVTRAQYAEVMEVEVEGVDVCPACPVVITLWLEAAIYTNRLSEREGLTPCYDEATPTHALPNNNPYECEGYRLPTDAEWEYTCKAQQQGIWACGDEAECLDSSAWYASNANNVEHPVASKEGHGGLFDMAGNLREHIHDPYHFESTGGRDPYVANSLEDFTLDRGFRGGSFSQGPEELRCAKRTGAGGASLEAGLRVVRGASR